MGAIRSSRAIKIYVGLGLGGQSKVGPLRPCTFLKNVTSNNDAVKMVMRSNLFGNLRLAVLCTRPASPPKVERRAASWNVDVRRLTKDPG